MRRIVHRLKNAVVNRKNPDALARFKRLQEFKNAKKEEGSARKKWENAERAYSRAAASGASKQKLEALLTKKLSAFNALENAFNHLNSFKKK